MPLYHRTRILKKTNPVNPLHIFGCNLKSVLFRYRAATEEITTERLHQMFTKDNLALINIRIEINLLATYIQDIKIFLKIRINIKYF